MIKNKFKSIMVAFTALLAILLGAITVDFGANKFASADTSFNLYLEGTSEYPTTKTGSVSMKLKLNNPSSAPIFGVQCKIHYDATCLTFVNATTSLSGWSGTVRYNSTGGYINIPLSAGQSSEQVYDTSITVATLNFTINTPSAQTYPFTIQDISVGGIDLSSGRAVEHAVTGQTFNLAFRTPNQDASLRSGVSVKASGVEVGSYNESTRTYTGTVPFKTTSVAISAIPNDVNATISGT